MKTTNLLKNVFAGTAILAFALTFTSCKKNDVDEEGSARIKVVNAATGSTDKRVYLANSVIIQGGLSFGDASDYISTNSGKNLELQFKNEGSEAAYASGKFNVDNGRDYTAFLVGDGQQARVKFFSDDLTTPASGQAKVRFIHLSDAAQQNIDIRRASGANLVANLVHDNASNFMSIEPGVLSLQVFTAGGDENLAGGPFNLTSFTAGRIYTVYITGSTGGSIAVNQITHN